MPRRVTVDSSKSVRDSSESRRPSVFERLGPGGSSVHREGSKQDKCRNWERDGSCPYGDTCHFQHGESSDALDLRHRVESKRAEKERGRDTSRDRSRGDRTPSPGGKRDRSKHRSSHKEWDSSDRKRKSREPSSMVVKGGGPSPGSSHGDGDDWRGYDNAPSADDDQMSDEYRLEMKRQELQRELARMDRIDQGQTGEDSGMDYSHSRVSSRSPSPVRKKAHGSKKIKKKDRSADRQRSPSPPPRPVLQPPEKRGKKKRSESSPGRKEAMPLHKKKKKVSPSPQKRGPRTPSLSPSSKKHKGREVRKKKPPASSKKEMSKKRVSSSESDSSSSSDSDSSSSGSSRSSSSSDSEEEYVKKKKLPVSASKKKVAALAPHHRQQRTPTPAKDRRSRTPPPKSKPRPPSPKMSHRYSPSTPTRSESSDSCRSTSSHRSPSPRPRPTKHEARRRSPTPEKRAPVKPKQSRLYSRSPSPAARKEKVHREPTPEHDSYQSRQSSSKESQYYPKRGRSPSVASSQKSYSPNRRHRDSLSPRRGEMPRGKQGLLRAPSGDYRDNRNDKYGGNMQASRQTGGRDLSAPRQQGRGNQGNQGSYDYNRRDTSSGRVDDRSGWQPGRGNGGGGGRGRGRGRGGSAGPRGGGRDYPGDRDLRYGGHPVQGQQWDQRGDQRGNQRGEQRGGDRERESRRDEWERQRGTGAPGGRYDQQRPPRGHMDRERNMPYGKRPVDDIRSQSPPGKRRQLTPYQQDRAKGSWQGSQGDNRYHQDRGPGPSPQDHRNEGRDYDTRNKWGRDSDNRVDRRGEERRDYPRDDRREMLRDDGRRTREGSTDSRGIADQFKHRDDQGYGDRRREVGRNEPRGTDTRYADRGGRRDDQEGSRKGYDERTERGRYTEERSSSRDVDRVGIDKYSRKRERPEDIPSSEDTGGFKRMREEEKDSRTRTVVSDTRKRPERYDEDFSDWSEGGSDELLKGSPSVRDRDKQARGGDRYDQKLKLNRDSSRESSRDRHSVDRHSLENKSRDRDTWPRDSASSKSRGDSIDRADNSTTQSQTSQRSRRSMSRMSTDSHSSSVVGAKDKQDDNQLESTCSRDQRSRAPSHESVTRLRPDPRPDDGRERTRSRERSEDRHQDVDKTCTQQQPDSSKPDKPYIGSDLPPTPQEGEKRRDAAEEIQPLGEAAPNLSSMQDDYEEISDDEFEDASDGGKPTRVDEHAKEDVGQHEEKHEAPDVMEVNWISMMKNLQEPLRSEVSAETSVLKRFSPGQVLARVGVSRALAGPSLVQEIEKVCRDSLKEEGGPTGEAPLFEHQLGTMNASAQWKWRQRQTLLQDIGPCRRALCARRDMAIRKQLRKTDKDSTEPIFSSAVDVDADLYRLSIQLLKNKQPSDTKASTAIAVTS